MGKKKLNSLKKYCSVRTKKMLIIKGRQIGIFLQNLSKKLKKATTQNLTEYRTGVLPIQRNASKPSSFGKSPGQTYGQFRYSHQGEAAHAPATAVAIAYDARQRVCNLKICSLLLPARRRRRSHVHVALYRSCHPTFDSNARA